MYITIAKVFFYATEKPCATNQNYPMTKFANYMPNPTGSATKIAPLFRWVGRHGPSKKRKGHQAESSPVAPKTSFSVF
jgi:hypothetical protein